MTQALATRDETVPAVTPDQMALVQRTVAAGASPDELKLYLYDCARQGVHPLDKLIHFTKRKGKYTPITSIDFMRTRAADTGEYAGSDDAVFAGKPKTDEFTATVTVWRLVGGQRCAFTATARWSEYKPAENDFMWQKMPHTMLAKCAEALALRKGFPRQLAGLYAKEEMDQAGEPQGYVVTAPNAFPPPQPAGELRQTIAVSSNGKTPDFGSGDAGSTPATAATDDGPDLGADLPAGASLIVRCQKRGVNLEITTFAGATHLIYKAQLQSLAEQCCQDRQPVTLELKRSGSGNEYVVGITKTLSKAELDATKFRHDEGADDGSTAF